MDDQQIYDFIKSDLTWHKPTQSFSSSDNFFKVLWNNALKNEGRDRDIAPSLDNMRQFRFNQNDLKSFKILGLNVGVKWDSINKRFKKLFIFINRRALMAKL